MTTTTDRPGLQGISHLGLTVVDLDRALDFWCGVMGFRLVIRTEEYCMVWHPAATLAIGLTTHGGAAVGPFDEHHAGLDHLALAVGSVELLRAWSARFAELGLTHSEIAETEAGHHLNVRAPDDIAVELFVLGPVFATSVLGLDADLAKEAVAVAGTHR